MRSLYLSTAVLHVVGSALAQTCTSQPSPASIRTLDPFAATSEVTAPAAPSPGFSGFSLLVDVDVQADVTVTGLQTWLWDQGLGLPPTPNQTGLSAAVNIYRCSTTVAGNELVRPDPGNPANPWTQVGTGTVVVEAFPGNSIVTLPAPIVLTQGSYGLAFEFTPPDPGDPANAGQANVGNAGPLHPLISSPGQAVLPSDAFLALQQTGYQNAAFASAAVFADDINLEIEYQPALSIATFESYGAGCYDRPQGFWEEQVPSQGAFDLANQSLEFGFSAASYTVTSGSAAFVLPGSQAGVTLTDVTATAPGVSLFGSWDDALAAPITLPFALAYPGGTTLQVTIGSNGFVFLAEVSDPDACFGYGGFFPDFTDFPARIAPMYGDLDPSAGGAIYYETDGATFARITWDGVPEWSAPATLSTFQVTLHASGDVDVVYGPAGYSAATVLTGFTPGNGVPVAGPIDFLAIAQGTPYQGGDGALAPALTFDANPVLGTTPNLTTSDITPGTQVGITVVSFQQDLAGTPLSAFGLEAPGCAAHVGIFGTANYFALVNAQGQLVVPFVIPVIPSLTGSVIYAQTAMQTSGYNGVGLLVSNGLCFRIGL